MYFKDWPPQSAYTYIKMTLLIPPVPFIWQYHTLCLVLNHVVLHRSQLTKCLEHLLHLLKRSVIQLKVATICFRSQTPFYVMHSLIFLLKHIERAHPPRAAQTDRTDKHQRNFYSPSKFAALYGNHLSGVTKNAGHEWFYRSLTLYRGHSHQSWCDYKTLLKAVADKNEWRLE